MWGRTRQEERVPGTCFVLDLAGHRAGGCQCWGHFGHVSPSVLLQLQELLHGAAEIAAPHSPLPSLAAFGVLDFVHTPAPSSQAGRSCLERLSKATLSCLLPAPCLEHTLIFLMDSYSNGSSGSVQPEPL